MFKIDKRKLKGVLGIVLIIVAAAGFFLWENYGREQFLYSDVVVLLEPVEKNTVIDVSMLGIKKFEHTTLIEGTIINPKEIIGKEAKHYIPSHASLIHEFFDDANMVLEKDEYIFSIPNNWLLNYPQSLRRKDTAYFYVVKEGESFSYDSYGNPVVSSLSITEPVCKAIVAYAKNNANQEVLSLDNERLQGTSNISMVEVVSKLETVNTMRSYIDSGHKFIILYQ